MCPSINSNGELHPRKIRTKLTMTLLNTIALLLFTASVLQVFATKHDRSNKSNEESEEAFQMDTAIGMFDTEAMGGSTFVKEMLQGLPTEQRSFEE